VGIEVQSVRFLLLACDRLGVNFTDTLTIGRQEIMASAAEINGAFHTAGRSLDRDAARQLSGEAGKISDPLFRELGAERVDSLDASDFEGATVIHDLNTPLPDPLAGRYSLVYDGGTLEHVFNVPVALANYMRMPRVGGHLLLALPANNEMGHGFYQFSPELFFRTLSPENGYQIKAMFLAPLFRNAAWLAVKDPATVGGRVGYNDRRDYQYLFVVAERLAAASIFETVPQQSDYSAEWDRVAGGEERWSRPAGRSARRLIADVLRPIVPGALRRWRARRSIGKRPRELQHFVPFDPGRDDVDGLRALFGAVSWR
jgi:hypothetical protein